jgi:hypothetical protein
LIVVGNVNHTCHTSSLQLSIPPGDGLLLVVVTRLTDADPASRHDPPATLLAFHLHHPQITRVIDRILLSVERPGPWACVAMNLPFFIPVMRDEAFAIDVDPLIRPIGQSLPVGKMWRWLCCCPGEPG